MIWIDLMDYPKRESVGLVMVRIDGVIDPLRVKIWRTRHEHEIWQIDDLAMNGNLIDPPQAWNVMDWQLLPGREFDGPTTNDIW